MIHGRASYYGPLFVRFWYKSKGNQREYFRLNNWFSLRCLGPWMFLNNSWYVILYGVEEFSNDCLLLIMATHYPSCAYYHFPRKWFHFEIAYSYQALSYYKEGVSTPSYLTHWGREIWPTFPRRHFEMHFLEWKCMNFDYNFTECCSWRSK